MCMQVWWILKHGHSVLSVRIFKAVRLLTGVGSPYSRGGAPYNPSSPPTTPCPSPTTLLLSHNPPLTTDPLPVQPPHLLSLPLPFPTPPIPCPTNKDVQWSVQVLQSRRRTVLLKSLNVVWISLLQQIIEHYYFKTNVLVIFRNLRIEKIKWNEK